MFTNKKLASLYVIALALGACTNASNPLSGGTLPGVSSASGPRTVLAKAYLDISKSSAGIVSARIASPSNSMFGAITDPGIDVTVTNDATRIFTAQMVNPLSGNASDNAVTLGTIEINTLLDNSLSLCGDGTVKCTGAVISAYTDNAAGAAGAAVSGLYNSASATSVPLMISLAAGGAPVAVPMMGGVNVDLESIDISASSVTSVLKSSFAVLGGAGVELAADFTDSASGVYHSRLVLVYSLTGAI
jgi:hypothetical protein